MYPYQPPDAPALPTAEIGTLIGLLRGGTLNTPEDLRCALAVVCYGAATLAPVPPHLKMTAPLSREDAADHLESLIRPKQGRIGGALPWGQIINIIIALLQAYVTANGG